MEIKYSDQQVVYTLLISLWSLNNFIAWFLREQT